MNITVRVDVEPVPVHGNGVPFAGEGQRSMWALTQYTGDQPKGGDREAFWSRRLAERVARERVEQMAAFLRHILNKPEWYT